MNLPSKSNLSPSPLLGAEFNERLVTLNDGRSGLRGGLQVEIHEPALRADPATPGTELPVVKETAAMLDFIASDETVDRCEEIISASGWRLESYRRNPVFQNAHQYGDVVFTLGKAILTEVRMTAGRPALFQRVQFAVDANPMARIAHALYKGKFLNAVSVGFIPLRWENGDGLKSSFPTAAGRAPSTLDTRHSPSFRRRYTEQELLEVSAVGIPANPNALQLGIQAGAIEKNDLKELIDLLRTYSSTAQRIPITPPLHDPIIPTPDFRSSPAARDTHACASGVRGNEAQLLQLARDCLQVLRNT